MAHICGQVTRLYSVRKTRLNRYFRDGISEYKYENCGFDSHPGQISLVLDDGDYVNGQKGRTANGEKDDAIVKIFSIKEEIGGQASKVT